MVRRRACVHQVSPENFAKRVRLWSASTEVIAEPSKRKPRIRTRKIVIKTRTATRNASMYVPVHPVTPEIGANVRNATITAFR